MGRENQRQDLKEERRREILEAALHVFAKRGFDKATVDEVAERAGLSKGAIYLYYKNKDALFFSLFEQKMDEARGPIGRAMRSAESLPDLVRNVVTAQLEFLQSNAEFFRIFSSEQARFDLDFQGDFRRLLRRRFNAYIGELGKAISRFIGPGRKELSRDLALSLIGMMNTHTTDWIVNHRSEPLTQKIDLIVHLFLKGVQQFVRESEQAPVGTASDGSQISRRFE